AGGPQINATLHDYGRQGSQVTQKSLTRAVEDQGYKNIRGTETSALHAVDFMYKIYAQTLVSPWVSMRMKNLLGGQLDTTKLAAGLPESAMFYHKVGCGDNYIYKVGIVNDGAVHCFVE